MLSSAAPCVITMTSGACVTIRIYIREMAGYSAKRQAALVGDGVHYVEDSMTARQRDAWLRSLRPGDVARVARLSLLAVPFVKNGPSPSADFISCVVRLMQRGVRIEEAETGITSDDKEAFATAVKQAGEQIARGRRLSSARGREIGAKGGKRAMQERSAFSVLSRPSHRPHLKTLRALWASVEHPTRAAAADAINGFLTEHGLEPLGSAQTIERAFAKLGQPLRRR